MPSDPQRYCWSGAARYVRSLVEVGRFRQEAVARRDYLEYGHDYCNRKNSTAWLIEGDVKLMQ